MVTKRAQLFFAVACLAPVLALAGCGGADSAAAGGASSQDSSGQAGSGSFEYVKADPSDVCQAGREGGTLNFRQGVLPEGAGVDPAAPQSNPLAAGAIYGTLVRWNDTDLAFEGDIAESITGNADSTIWTLKLRDNVTYSDGTKLDAAAVKQNIERYLDPAYASLWTARVAEIKQMDIQDPQTLVFTLNSAWGTFPWLLAQNVGMIVNPAVLASPDVLSSAPPANAGAGAYTFKSYERGVAMELTGKADWWGGPVCLNQLNLSFGSGDSNADYEALKAGQVMSFMSLDTPVIAHAQEDESLNLYALPPVNASPMQFNAAAGAPMDDVRFRQAVQFAMDRDLINSRVFDGLSEPTGGIVPRSFKFTPTVQPLGFDEAKAKDLVQQIVADGVPTDFAYTIARTPTLENLGILTQALLKNAGLTMTPDLLQIQDWVEKVYTNRNFDAANSGIQMHESCAYCALDMYVSTSGSPFAFNSPQLDAALANLKAARPGDETSVALGGVQEVWNKEMPAVIQVWLPQVLALDKSVHGVRLSTNLAVDFSKAYVS